MLLPLPSKNAGSLDHAIYYAKQGFAVAPYHSPVGKIGGECSCELGADCPQPGKHPRIKDWSRSATTNLEQIEEWWARWPWANITVITGAESGIIVLDFDGPQGIATHRALERKFGALPPAPMTRSGGGGLHIWFRHPGHGVHVPSGNKILGPGGDVKADGGVGITVPPSRWTPSAEKRGERAPWIAEYTWLEPNLATIEIPMIPGWVLEQLDRTIETNETPVGEDETSTATYRPVRARGGGAAHERASYQLPAGPIPSGRNEEMHRYASSLRARGAEQHEIATAIAEANERLCSPPLIHSELAWIIASAMRYPPGERRGDPLAPTLRLVRRESEPEPDVPPPDEPPPARARTRPSPSTPPPGPPDPPWWEAASPTPPKPRMGAGESFPDIGESLEWQDDPPEFDDEGDGGQGRGGGGRGGGGGGKRKPAPVCLAGPDGIPMTDIGNAERVRRDHGDDIRYVGTTKRWYVWTGVRWDHDQKGRAQRLAAITARRMHPLVFDCQGEEHQKAWRAHIKSSESSRGLHHALDCLSMNRDIARSPEDLDRDTQGLLNTPQGVLDLRTLVLSPHRREPMITKVTRAEYDPKAKCPRWEAFLYQVLGEDLEMVRYMQRVAGYSLTGETTEHVLLFLYGLGSNGKSTVVETLRNLIGHYGRTTDFTTFMDDRADKMREDLADLRGSRMVTASEPEAGSRFAEGTIKKMTGGDQISCRHMYGSRFEYIPEYKVWLSANHKPVIRGQDEGIWRRFHLIPFEVTIAPDKRDLELSNKLKAEWPGILAWAARGAADWYSGRLQAPAKVMAATADYRDEMDTVGSFLNDCFHMGPSFPGASAALVFDEYQAWARRNGQRHLLERRQLSRILKERGFVSEKRGGQRIYPNWGLKAKEDREDDSDEDVG